jgi:diguanylate cyclase (GGDEF)-like protein/PAS domain S-box-containing protein
MRSAWDTDCRLIGPAGLVGVSSDNPSPVLLLGLDARVLEANRGSWLVLQEWGVAYGDIIPEPWLSTALGALESGETREATLSVGIAGVLLLFVPAAEHGFIYVFGVDVTARKQLEQQIALNAQVFESAAEGILIMDAALRVIDVNPAYTTITGYTPEEVLGERPSFWRQDLQGADFVEQLARALTRHGRWQGELEQHRKDGSRYTERLSVSSVSGEQGEVTHYTAVLADITQQKEAERQLLRLANYDMLTGLPNRRLFQERFDKAMAAAEANGECIGILLVDLDGFKLVNDQLGHSAGDQTLRIISQRISHCLRTSDTVARMGGDEFLVLLRDLRGIENVVQVAEKVLSRIAEPVNMEGREFYLTASIGVSGYVRGQSSEELIRRLDKAMYSAKRSGKNRFRFASEDLMEYAGERLMRQARLRQAIARGEIHPYYQRIVDVGEGRLAGLEVLARWISPEEGIVKPVDFIPIAEESGLINPLGEHILRSACSQGAAWRAQGLTTVFLSVNVSVRQLRDEDFVHTVEEILAETGFPARLLHLELSEAIWIEGIELIATKLNRLRALGITISIDDFGTQYASLSYLKRLPVDCLKIDKSFVDEVPGDEASSAILSSILSMATAMGLDVIAEGVETRQQLDFLMDHGCRYVQGYYFDRPAPGASALPQAALPRATHDEYILCDGAPSAP